MQVILDVSPVIGIPQGLPARDVIVSMNHREAQQIINQSAKRGLGQGQSQRCGQAREAGSVASLVASLLGRPLWCVPGLRAPISPGRRLAQMPQM